MPEFKKFTGLRNDVSAERFELSDLAIANNVNIDDTGKIVLRDGYLQKLAGAYHSLWSNGTTCLYVIGTELRQLMSNLSASALDRKSVV